MHIATKTLAAINEAIHRDQGGTYRQHLKRLMPLADDAYRAEESEFRAHLGASIIGRNCAREAWYSFHWTTSRKFDGRMLRLFNRGHLEEPRMIAALLTIGCTYYQFDANGKQFRIGDHRGHYGGSLDGVVVGLPDLAPGIPALGEFKTHNDKSFSKLKEAGVMSAKYEHFVQMQQYMGKKDLTVALYMATNKNDDDLHAELVQFDPIIYQKYLNLAGAIIDAPTPPPKIADTPGFFKCKFCDHNKTCHLKAPPARNCRTCRYSIPVHDAKWECSFHCINLDEELQLAGCQQYEVNPHI